MSEEEVYAPVDFEVFMIVHGMFAGCYLASPENMH